MWYYKNPWWVGNFENLSFLWLSTTNLIFDIWKDIRLYWYLETYIYKSQSESWMYECFACIQILLITPFINAKVERMFSQMEKIKTDWRNHLGCDRLESLLRISEEDQSLWKFNPTTTIKRWFNDKVSHLSSSSHKYQEKRRKDSGQHSNTSHVRPWRWKRQVCKFWLNIAYSWIELFLYSDKKVK